MNNPTKALRNRFTTPSTELVESNPTCRICWTDYDSTHPAVHVHVFGKECILAWAQGTTLAGSYNGCPFCRAELLAPNLFSRCRGLADSFMEYFQTFLGCLGEGPYGRRLFIALAILRVATPLFSDFKVVENIEYCLNIEMIVHICCESAKTSGMEEIGWREVGQEFLAVYGELRGMASFGMSRYSIANSNGYADLGWRRVIICVVVPWFVEHIYAMVVPGFNTGWIRVTDEVFMGAICYAIFHALQLLE